MAAAALHMAATVMGHAPALQLGCRVGGSLPGHRAAGTLALARGMAPISLDPLPVRPVQVGRSDSQLQLAPSTTSASRARTASPAVMPTNWCSCLQSSVLAFVLTVRRETSRRADATCSAAAVRGILAAPPQERKWSCERNRYHRLHNWAPLACERGSDWVPPLSSDRERLPLARGRGK